MASRTSWLATARIPNTHVAVTPSDTESAATELPITTVSLFIGGAGNVKAELWGDTTECIYVGLAAGSEIAGNFRYVKSTSTTATSILARGSV